MGANELAEGAKRASASVLWGPGDQWRLCTEKWGQGMLGVRHRNRHYCPSPGLPHQVAVGEEGAGMLTCHSSIQRLHPKLFTFHRAGHYGRVDSATQLPASHLVLATH